MFVATLSNGKIVAEGKDIAHFDDCPEGIVSIQLLLPHVIYRVAGDQTVARQSVISIGRYDRYYSAKQAVANIMSMGGNVGHMISQGQGQITHEIIAGIDDQTNEVVYIKVNINTGDVTLDKFSYETFLKDYNVNPEKLKKGAPRK